MSLLPKDETKGTIFNFQIMIFKCHQALGAEKCDRCMRCGLDCGPRLLPRNDHHRRDAGSKKRIMQRIISLFESGVGEATIMEALDGISPRTPEENVPELELEDIVLFDFDTFLANLNDFPSQD